MASPTYDHYAYWGKASPSPGDDKAVYHLLVYHSLDVAAVAATLNRLPQFGLDRMAHDLEWDLAIVQRLQKFFSALHDLGKFSRAFQGLAPGLSPRLVPPIASKHYQHCKHDTMGWLLWQDYLSVDFPGESLPCADEGFWAGWIKAVVGHHGRPPMEVSHNGVMPLSADDYFSSADIVAAREFTAAVAELFGLQEIPVPTRSSQVALKRHGWRLAGLAVLADWLGSDQRYFRYHADPMPLDQYWHTVALPTAEAVVAAAGLVSATVRPWARPLELFDYLDPPTPLQRLAAEIPLQAGPQLFLLEDVTGAGKTEAALILAYRLMASSKAEGFYIGLPTMATANQMYPRIASAYRAFYDAHAEPSLVLSHGARELVGAFRTSVLAPAGLAQDRSYSHGEGSATAQCSAWLADSRKKALLAHVGVGTLDQALLSVLPVRHQSLRLIGLAGKVLIADEVHAYDPYMRTLLAKLLDAHASQGGSAVLLSATLPADMRRELVQAFLRGRGSVVDDVPDDIRYPLVTHAHEGVSVLPCATRPEVERVVQIQWHHVESDVQRLILEQAQAGRSVCWIRNTVGDARRTYSDLQAAGAQQLTLFHSRYAMGDRLAIEDDVLAHFGKISTAADRSGRILVATQVVEQSLDLDFDVLITDLAPIDLIVQRAGRLHRHRRDLHGNPARIEGRAAPILYIFGPEPDLAPRVDWYDSLLPGASKVYPDHGRLWLTQQALLSAGCIVSPGLPGQTGAVRGLVEGVYGKDAPAVPEALLTASSRQEGASMAHVSQAHFNALQLELGYSEDSSRHWYEDTEVPTRLSEEISVPVYLARVSESDDLIPWFDGGELSWEQSSLRIDMRRIAGLSKEWRLRFDDRIAALRASRKLLDEPAVVLPLSVDDAGIGHAEIVDSGGKKRLVIYGAKTGWSSD